MTLNFKDQNHLWTKDKYHIWELSHTYVTPL